MTLGDKLSKLRKENNYTQEQLADVLGVSRQSISKWESDIAFPETDKLIHICKLFHCTTDYLLLDENGSTNNKRNCPCELLPDNQLLMAEVQKYIDRLFAYQYKDVKAANLKKEILDNMTAKINNYILQGMSETRAFQLAKSEILSEERISSDNQLTDMRKYALQCSYFVLLNCTLFWIATLPLLFVKYAPICFVGLVATIISGVCYIVKTKDCKKEKLISLISISESRRRRKRVWILWGVFFSIIVLAIAMASFSSNIWFSRPIEITGPYMFANLMVRFYVPALTIFIPMTIGGFTKQLSKCEMRCENE